MAKIKFKSLKESRLNINKTQFEIAKIVGISESYYNLIENGNRVPPVNTAALIAKTLNITLDEFFLLYNFTKCEVTT